MSRTARSSGVLGSSAVMAAGTVFSRLSGVIRTMLLVAALGNALHADVFNIANTIPNMLYILLAGGVFNAVLVPQLVRAMKNDVDGGDGYVNRVVTLAGLFLAGATAVLVIGAPWVMRLVLDGAYFTPALAAQRESAIDFARYCLPQVFFYGMFVLVGQVLNARGRFGPMMWAPIANNAISIAVIGGYLWWFGPAHGAQQCAAYGGGQEALLGLGSTIGIAAQFLILLPYLRLAGFRYRPRFDFRGSGLGHTFRLGIWTVLFVVVNQVAFTVVTRLASSGTAQAAASGCAAGGGSATGYTVYSNAFLLIMVPHSVITVSLATAILPRLSRQAADGDLRGVSRSVASTLRTSYALVVPFALLLPLVALPVSNLIFDYGASSATYGDYVSSLVLFAPGLVLFTAHYMVLRGFYSLERNRTVFWVQCVVAAVNIGLAVLLTHTTDPAKTAPGLVLAYTGSYLAGAVLSYALLRRLLGGLETPATVRFLVRLLLAAGAATLVAWAVKQGLLQAWSTDGSKAHALVVLVLVGTVDALAYLLLARVLRIGEVTSIVGLVARRLGR